MKLLLEEMVSAVGVKVQYHTRVVAAVRDANNRLSLVLTESKSGRQAWRAKAFIDTTGDGDVAALAGCKFDYGAPGNPSEGGGLAQPMSLMALLTGLDVEQVAPFTRSRRRSRRLGRSERSPARRNEKGRQHAVVRKADDVPPSRRPLRADGEPRVRRVADGRRRDDRRHDAGPRRVAQARQRPPRASADRGAR